MATLLQKYQSFLARPVATQLSDNASIVYTTTAEVIQGRDALVKHFEKYNQLFAKRTDKQISVVETQDTLVYETDTLIEFRTGGGSFLPGLDDNFLADQTVNFVLVCSNVLPVLLLMIHRSTSLNFVEGLFSKCVFIGINLLFSSSSASSVVVEGTGQSRKDSSKSKLSAELYLGFRRNQDLQRLLLVDESPEVAARRRSKVRIPPLHVETPVETWTYSHQLKNRKRTDHDTDQQLFQQ